METNDKKEKKTKDKELFEKGWFLHVDHMYDRAAKCYQKAAELGNTEALYFLALLYYEGKGVKKDFAEAARCFEVVAEKGGKYSKEAQLRLERLADIDSGKGIGIIGVDMDYSIACGCGFGSEDVDEYRRMWKMAEQGDMEAQKYVASAIYNYMNCADNPETDGETMMRYLRNFAELGFAEAQNMLADTLINDSISGVGIGDLDYEEALKWFREAAQDGYWDAQWKLANFLYDGSFFGRSHPCLKQDKEEAFLWQMHQLETAKNSFALETIGYPYTEGDGKWWTTQEVFALCKKYAQQEDELAQRNLGYFYFYGKCVKKNLATAFVWFTKAAEQGDETAELFLSEHYYEGEDDEQNSKEAFKWYRIAAEQGCVDAMNELADWYCWGIRVEKNYDEAFKWYRIAAEQGCAAAMNELANLYYSGAGVEKNYDEAHKWYTKEDELCGSIYGIYGGLTSMYRTGDVPSKYYKKDMARFKKEADNYNRDACYRLGLMYHNGYGVKPNDKAALHWYKKMTKITCDPSMMEMLADMFYEGDGINQSYEEAIKWYKKAANERSYRSFDAGIRLIELWDEDKEVKPDFRTVYKWIKYLAKEWEYPEFQYKLGIIYLEGKYLKKNRKKAIFWIKKAAEQDYEPAQKKLAKLGE